MPITKRDVEALEKNAILWDTGRGAVMGFGVRRQRARPVFVLKSRIDGKQRWFSIGTFGAPWTVESARDQAKVLLGQIAEGIDPAQKADLDDTASLTVANLCDRYMEAAERGQVLTRFQQPKRASTLAIDVGRIERHIKPLIGRKLVRDISRTDIAHLIDDVTAGKTAADIKTGLRGRAIVKGGAGTAARVADLLSGIFSWAVRRDLAEHNPVHGAERYRGAPKERFLSSQELARFGRVLTIGKDASGKAIHPHAIQILWLLSLTGCRLNEIAGLRWDEVDTEAKCLRLAQTKTGRSLRAIGSPAVARLTALSRQPGSPFVFPSFDGSSHYQGTKREVLRIMEAAEIADATCHTLRHTFATMASELEYSELTIAGLLGHSIRTVTSRYAHRPDTSLVAAAEAVSDRVERAMA